MVFNRLDFETEVVVKDDRKIVHIKLIKKSALPVSYNVRMKAGEIELGTVKAGKLLFAKEMDLEIDEGIPADTPISGDVRSWGLLGLVLPNDEGSFEG